MTERINDMKSHDLWAAAYCPLTRGPLMSAYPAAFGKPALGPLG